MARSSSPPTAASPTGARSSTTPPSPPPSSTGCSTTAPCSRSTGPATGCAATTTASSSSAPASTPRSPAANRPHRPLADRENGSQRLDRNGSRSKWGIFVSRTGESGRALTHERTSFSHARRRSSKNRTRAGRRLRAVSSQDDGRRRRAAGLRWGLRWRPEARQASRWGLRLSYGGVAPALTRQRGMARPSSRAAIIYGNVRR